MSRHYELRDWMLKHAPIRSAHVGVQGPLFGKRAASTVRLFGRSDGQPVSITVTRAEYDRAVSQIIAQHNRLAAHVALRTRRPHAGSTQLPLLP